MSAAHPENFAENPSTGLRELGVTCTRLAVEDVGFGAVAWLRVVPGASALKTLSVQESTARDGALGLKIGETGQVPELEVENRGGEPCLLPAHLVLSGGWQTRAVERSVIVPAGGVARVPVKCVEAGRWAPRDERTAKSFEVADRTGVRTRWSTSRSMAEQLARNGRFAAEQSAVWQQVDEELTRSPIASRTRSYEAYLQGVKRRLVVEAKRAAVRPPAAANGVAIFPRGGGFWIEAYPTPEALADHADDLLADLFDPAQKDEIGTHAPDLDGMLEAIAAMPLRRLDHIAGTTGDTYAIAGRVRRSSLPADAPGAELSAAGAALVVDGTLAHLAVGAAPRGLDAGASGDRRMEQPQHPARRAEESSVSKQSASMSSAAPVVASGDGANERPRVDLETMRGVFARARDMLPEGPPARERVQGYRLVRVLDRNISWVDVRITGEGYAVLGSHDRCDLVLSNDAGIWLRHMVAVCVRLEDSTVGLRLIDLKTDLPFFVDDDTVRWSIIARGPFAMRLGRHVVCGFPIGPGSDDRQSSSVPERPRNTGPQLEPARVRDAGATGVIETGITGAVDARSLLEVPALNELSSFLPAQPVSQIQDLLGASVTADHVRVTLERGGMGASVELPMEALDNGVLLGRALNCFDGGLRRIFCEAISRAHVLLVRDKDDVYAFDLCSTNGTRAGGQRIRRYRLSDGGSTLELGKKVLFRWHRREPK